MRCLLFNRNFESNKTYSRAFTMDNIDFLCNHWWNMTRLFRSLLIFSVLPCKVFACHFFFVIKFAPASWKIGKCNDFLNDSWYDLEVPKKELKNAQKKNLWICFISTTFHFCLLSSYVYITQEQIWNIFLQVCLALIDNIFGYRTFCTHFKEKT